jgi:formiminotetrahydrofolate cyclodeaminase
MAKFLVKEVIMVSDLPVIKELTVTEYLLQLSSDSLFPSAGASAALTAAQAAALFGMVCRVNLRKLNEIGINSGDSKETIRWCKNEVGAGEIWSFWSDLTQVCDRISSECLGLAQADGEAYRAYVDNDPQGAAQSIEVPLSIAHCDIEIMKLIDTSLSKSYYPVRADAETAHNLAQGSRSASLVVARYNLPLLGSDEERHSYREKIDELEPVTCSGGPW